MTDGVRMFFYPSLWLDRGTALKMSEKSASFQENLQKASETIAQDHFSIITTKSGCLNRDLSTELDE